MRNLKPLVILREDDANATTTAEDLERIYGTLINSDIPINVAVIPSVYCASKLPPGHPILPSEEYFPYIHFSKGRNTYLNINANKKLISLIQAGNFETLQHGYSHERIHGSPEFSIKDTVQLENRILEGKRILYEAFEKEPSFFVAPHEQFSREALKVVSRHFLGTFVSDLSWRARAKRRPVQLAFYSLWPRDSAIQLPPVACHRKNHGQRVLSFQKQFSGARNSWVIFAPPLHF
jgi:hypothetical protein